jgi:Family of unknown function (DUF6677)
MPPENSADQAPNEANDGAVLGDGAQVVAVPAARTDSHPSANPANGSRGRHHPLAYAIAVAAWLVPGMGHALLKMWGRAAACFLTVGVLVMLGAGMRGNIFTSGGNDAFDTLGYVADLGAGSFYFVARAIEIAGADVSHANGDYGTRFLATAGILNLLAALHAFEAARGHKA